MSAHSVGSGSRDVIGVILALRHELRAVPSDRCPEVAAEYLCDLFDGSMVAVNLMDYGRSRFHTVANVGELVPREKRSPVGEYYAFADFPFTTQHLRRGAAYRSDLSDRSCPAEYREMLAADRRTGCLGAPIRLNGTALGEFWVARNNEKPFSDVDEDLAAACGATLARFCRTPWREAG
jgi:hypothetical protein